MPPSAGPVKAAMLDSSGRIFEIDFASARGDGAAGVGKGVHMSLRL
jgi:hypothetical protein